MSRNLKALGLALVAVFAFSAISASGASAVTAPIAHFTCSAYPCTLKGEEEETHKFTLFGGELTCEEVAFEGELTKASTSVTIKPTYNKCITDALGVKRPTTVTTNGCTYTFTVHAKRTYKSSEAETLATPETETTGGVVTHFYHGDLHLLCPVGVKGIEIHVFNNAAHTELRCTYTVKPQTVDKIDYKSITGSPKKDVTVEPTTPAVAVTRTSGTLLQCGAENQTAEYHGPTTVKAFKGAEQIDGGIENVVT